MCRGCQINWNDPWPWFSQEEEGWWTTDTTQHQRPNQSPFTEYKCETNAVLMRNYNMCFGASLPFEGQWNCHWLGRWGLSKAPLVSCGALKPYHIAGPWTAPPSSSRNKEKSLKRSLELKCDMLFDNIAPNTARTRIQLHNNKDA